MSAPNQRHLFLTCRKTRKRFLVDTGSDVSVYLRSAVRVVDMTSTLNLYAANGTVIETYVYVTIEPDFGMRRNYTWRFIKPM